MARPSPQTGREDRACRRSGLPKRAELLIGDGLDRERSGGDHHRDDVEDAEWARAGRECRDQRERAEVDP
jgi:hypothetical protein